MIPFLKRVHSVTLVVHSRSTEVGRTTVALAFVPFLISFRGDSGRFERGESY